MSRSLEANEKNDTQGHFCWIRVLHVKKGARRARGRLLAGQKTNLTADNRPPPKIRASSKLKADVNEGWTAVEEVMGRDNARTAFDYGPAFVLKCEAEEWILTPEGQAWDADAENRLLISFIGDLGPNIPLEEKEPGPLPSTGITQFPADAWDPGLHFRWAHRANDKPDFLGEAMSLTPTNLYPQERPAVIYGPNADDTSAAADKVYAEAHGAARVTAELFGVVGLDLDATPVDLDMKHARSALMDLVEQVVYPLKAFHNRPRPWMVFPGLQPMFGGEDWRNPRHPAYPAGHGVTAGLWATLLAHKYPRHRRALQDAADAIAQRRVGSGLHFQSDVDDGLALGRRMARVVLDHLQAGTLPEELEAFRLAFEQLP